MGRNINFLTNIKIIQEKLSNGSSKLQVFGSDIELLDSSDPKSKNITLNTDTVIPIKITGKSTRNLTLILPSNTTIKAPYLNFVVTDKFNRKIKYNYDGINLIRTPYDNYLYISVSQDREFKLCGPNEKPPKCTKDEVTLNITNTENKTRQLNVVKKQEGGQNSVEIKTTSDEIIYPPFRYTYDDNVIVKSSFTYDSVSQSKKIEPFSQYSAATDGTIICMKKVMIYVLFFIIIFLLYRKITVHSNTLGSFS